MKLDKKLVAQNLRLFGYRRYGSMKDFAEALDMNPSTLYSGYLNARSLPGPVLIVKLIDLGCDINWLLTGRETPSSVDESVKSEQSPAGQQSIPKRIDGSGSIRSAVIHSKKNSRIFPVPRT